MIPLTSSEIEDIAAAAANRAVRELLVAMGVDANDPKSLIEMQRDFAHIRRWRQSVDTVRNQGLILAIGIILSGVAGAIWMAIRGAH